MTSKKGPITGLIGSYIMLIGVIILLPWSSYGLSMPYIVYIAVLWLVWPVLGIIGAIIGFSGKKYLGGSFLLIASIGSGITSVLGLAITVWYIDVCLMLTGGFLVLIVAERKLDEPQIEFTKRKLKRSRILFIIGSVVIGISSLTLWLILGSRPLYMFLFISIFVAPPAYFFSVILIAYSIQLKGFKWAWLDTPITIACFIIVMPQLLTKNPLIYRPLLFSIIPLNYVVLLILFLVFNRKNKRQKLSPS
jgi:hypothetical protein